MPRSFDMAADFQGSVEEVHRAFRELEYWRARLADIPVDLAAVESMRVGGESGSDGTIEVVTVQTVHSHNLPGLVTQLHAGDLSIKREEIWGPVSDGAATASISGSILDTPVNVWGTALLAPNAESGGARQTFHITVQVRAPIIGGKIEKMIGGQLAELVSWEQRFTSEWIANNA
jgi:hypothetical protein